jgi:hypothetical protein
MAVADFARRLAKRAFGRAAIWLSIAVVVLGLCAGQAAAQLISGQDPTQLLAEQDRLFQQMLRAPGNLDVAFAYARVSAQLGDNEAAATALERMLLFNPNLPRIDVELGALYFRMGSFDLARDYFTKALAANAPPDVKARASRYLAEIAAQESPSHFEGYVFFGAQYQTDANVAPGSPLIHSPVGDVLLSSQFVKRPDTNIFGSGAFLYSYDLGTQSHDAVEVTGIGFMNHYFRTQRLDLDFAEVTAGPRFNLPSPDDRVSRLSVKPYAIVNEVGLGEAQYFKSLGTGLESTARLWEDLAVRTFFEFREKDFSNARDRPLSSGLDGNDKLVTLQLRQRVTANSELLGQFDFLDQDTRSPWYANRTYAASAGYHIAYDDPTGWTGFPWETTIGASRLWSLYQSPDPCCNTSSNPAVFVPAKRDDRRWRFGIAQAVPVAENVALVVQFQRDIVSSNLSLYAYTSNSVLVGTQIKF